MGTVVGFRVVGAEDGAPLSTVGASDGRKLGAIVVGCSVGTRVGRSVGVRVGWSVGRIVGACVGKKDGTLVGALESKRNFGTMPEEFVLSFCSEPLIPPNWLCDAARVKARRPPHTINIATRKYLSVSFFKYSLLLCDRNAGSTTTKLTTPATADTTMPRTFPVLPKS